MWCGIMNLLFMMDWIGLRENLNQKPWLFPPNPGFSLSNLVVHHFAGHSHDIRAIAIWNSYQAPPLKNGPIFKVYRWLNGSTTKSNGTLQ